MSDNTPIESLSENDQATSTKTVEADHEMVSAISIDNTDAVPKVDACVDKTHIDSVVEQKQLDDEKEVRVTAKDIGSTSSTSDAVEKALPVSDEQKEKAAERKLLKKIELNLQTILEYFVADGGNQQRAATYPAPKEPSSSVATTDATAVSTISTVIPEGPMSPQVETNANASA